jgi:Fe-S cluster biosynthesis and repair protein YggX
MDDRIEQFKKMTQSDPGNELGHFSLGRAYMDAGRHDEAIPCLERVIQLNENSAKAYHLLGLAQKATGDRAGAVATLLKGFRVAHARGELMPRNEMAALLKELGEPVPVVEEAKPSAAPPGGGEQLVCKRCGQARPRMPERPFKGALGEQVWANVCPSCWQEWVHMGTKVINEMRLDFSNPRHSAVYDEHMKEFLNLT